MVVAQAELEALVTLLDNQERLVVIQFLLLSHQQAVVLVVDQAEVGLLTAKQVVTEAQVAEQVVLLHQVRLLEDQVIHHQ